MSGIINLTEIEERQNYLWFYLNKIQQAINNIKGENTMTKFNLFYELWKTTSHLWEYGQCKNEYESLSVITELNEVNKLMNKHMDDITSKFGTYNVSERQIGFNIQ